MWLYPCPAYTAGAIACCLFLGLGHLLVGIGAGLPSRTATFLGNIRPLGRIVIVLTISPVVLVWAPTALATGPTTGSGGTVVDLRIGVGIG
jgi:hypothetical protein